GPPTRWKRSAAIMGGAALAASIAVVGAWSLLAPPPSPPPLPPLARPTPASTFTREPVSAPPASRAPAVVTAPAPPPKTERRERLRPPQAPANATRERPASSNDAEGDDPGAVIDWLRNRSSTRGG